MNTTPGATTADNSGNFDPRQAAALLDQTTQRARRTLAAGTPALWTFRAVLVLVAFGGFWLSVRGQHPYSGPTGAALPVAFALVGINIIWSALALRRAGAGVTGPVQRRRHAWAGVMAAVVVAANVVPWSLYPAGASYPAWGLYQSSVPLLIVGVLGAATAAALHYWRTVGTLLAMAVVAAIAGFGGPVGSWLIMGIGLCGVCLATAAFIARERRRSVIRP